MILIPSVLLVVGVLTSSNLRAKRIKFIRAVRATKQVEEWQRSVSK